MFCQKGVLKNLEKFTGNPPFNNVARSSPTLLKKRPLHRCFPMKFAKISRTPPVAASEDCKKVVITWNIWSSKVGFVTV